MVDGPPAAQPSNDTFDYEHNPTWRIFRIMSEFVEGFTFLARIQRSVTFFGSARLPATHPYAHLARELAQRLAREGYTIVTGGGPGIMQAANQGACEGGGDSVGLNIQLPHEQRINPYVRRSMSFHYFFSRKVMLDFSAEAYVFLPGGYGTLDELFEVLTLIQTGKMEGDVPVILLGTDFWAPLCAWLRGTLLERLQTISPADLTIWTLTDDLDEALRLIHQAVAAQAQRHVAATGRPQKNADDRLRQATHQMRGTEQ
jgi:uncharacterized protein (TIGR00730 family)